MIPRKETNERYFTVFNVLDYKKYKINDIPEESNIFFTDIKHIFAYCNNGPFIREIEIAYDGKILNYNNTEFPEYRSTRPIIGLGHRLNSLTTIKYFVEILGADISVSDYAIIKWSILYGDQDIYDYLITKLDNNQKEYVFAKII